MLVLTPILAVLAGLGLLIWSSNRFVDGAAATARVLGISPLVIGMVIIGFGTSAPELVVSVISALDGKPALALGNAYGSNIANIALILGTTAVLYPIRLKSQVLRRELPLLAAMTGVAYLTVRDLELTRLEGGLSLLVFLLVICWTMWMAFKQPEDELLAEVQKETLVPIENGLGRPLLNLLMGLVFLLLSSRMLVWGAVELATLARVSELVIGLTVVAVGTSLPELASTLVAVRKGEHDMALGNVVGSNMFNTLAVVGIASSICPFPVETEVLTRDFPVMSLLTLSLFVAGYSRKGRGRINRVEGALLLLAFVGYTSWLVVQVLQAR